tara:strand:- start:674 stop:802 length:129 start_codon:yes stop_codon:yes gene_type:complete
VRIATTGEAADAHADVDIAGARREVAHQKAASFQFLHFRHQK